MIRRMTLHISVLCPESNFFFRLLDEFKAAVQKWKNWNTLTVLQNHQLIKDDLSDLFYHCLQVGSFQAV